MLTRRAALVAPLALTACGGLPPAQNIAVVAQDVQIIATGLSKSLLQMSALNLPGLTPAILDICQTALAGIQTVAQALASVSTTTDAQPLVVRVEGYVNTFVGALLIIPVLPQEIKTALIAAQLLLPVIEAAVNLAVPPKTATPTLTPDQARTVLKSTPAVGKP